MYRLREQLVTGSLILQTEDGGVWRDVVDVTRGERFHIVTESEAVLQAAELAYYKGLAGQREPAALSEARVRRSGCSRAVEMNKGDTSATPSTVERGASNSLGMSENVYYLKCTCGNLFPVKDSDAARAIRKAALEKAARLCETNLGLHWDASPSDCAAAIRVLISKET